jgi:hemoglobin-like flavoprotein
MDAVTPQQVELVESSVVALGSRLDDLGTGFYDRLFALEPDVRRLFTSDLVAQRTKFASELAYIVTVIRRHDVFESSAHELGRRHGELGVEPGHVRSAGRALLGALEATLGDRWTDELATAWRLAYRLTAEAMLAGARQRARDR